MFATIFWTIYIGLLGTAAIGFLIKGKYKTTLSKIDFALSVITWIGLFGFVTDTQIWTPLIWKIVFFVGLAWEILYGVFLNDHYGEEPEEDVPFIIVIIFFIIFVGPLYYGLYSYAF
ncbi:MULTISPECIES: hypothetical protein [Bacillaceae]|uniref:hypothetical protein n=1 Tax=Bacillaceae TaxID=186817 RepID=UPI001E5ACEB0|nr:MULTISPECIES: hypothetical protein [Bacillaceae]MCE4047654.1 hypothetical protein [Bacillus sp. Au-Bac7]MCM3031100.1 hypothetical protein [Niallia sp. MER 6]MDL0437393.1 hypothetical protein [Niallia sp. SS-2023]UPO86005.1 hypothetical protein L8T27_010225 [Niallia sp. Man26]